MSVPKAYEGLWRRTVIRRKNGQSDVTTRVWWFQSARWHIDLRIPLSRPQIANIGVLAALTAEQRAAFARQSGFAGRTVVAGRRCEWQPEIAFPAIGDELDAGWMDFTGPDALHETGLDDSYDEDWVRVPTGPMRALRLAAADGALAYLLLGEDWGAWATGRPQDRFDAGSFGEFSVLQRHDGHWRIAASNLPWREGCAAVLPSDREWRVGEKLLLEREWVIKAVD
jgi:hypothetical protein